MTDNTAPYPFDLAETDRLLTTTRAVRKRLDLDRPVERQVLLDCIDIAQQAPTGSNSQSWRWLIVTDPAKRQLIADAYREASADYFAHAQDLSKTRDPPQNERVRSSSTFLREEMQQVPVLVIPCAAGGSANMTLEQQAGFYGSIVPASWSFMLALRSRGLGSVYTTLHLGLADKVAQALNIPDHYTQTALIPVAYTKGTDFKPADRPPVQRIVKFDSW